MVTELSNEKRKYSSLTEVSRKDLISKSRRGSKERYNKRLNYQVANFRGVDLSQFFNNDYLVYDTPINDYVVTLAFPGVLTELKKVCRTTNGDIKKVNYQLVLKALRRAFDATDDVKVRCSCADFTYRFMYWANKNGYLYGPMVKGTEQFPEKTNPDDMLGATCKHLDLFLSNKRWLIKAASIVTSIIKAYPEKAEKYLYDPEDLKKNEEPTEEPESEETTEEVPEEPVEDDDSTDEEVED